MIDSKGLGYVRHDGPPHPPRPQADRVLEHGPGSELKAIFETLGITPDGSCGCEVMMRRMNRYGVAGCRQHRERILKFLRETAAKKGWATKLAAAGNAVWSGLAFRVNPLDPLPDL